MTPNPSPEMSPAQDPPLSQVVEKLLQQLTALWWESGPKGFPNPSGLAASYTPREQQSREAHLASFLDSLTAELRHLPRTGAERRAVQERIMTAFAAMARAALGWEDRHVQLLLTRGFLQAGTQFAQGARRFDPAISGDDIFQASRNAWTVNGVQLLIGLPVRLTPAIFAYSMLYPYSDNYLDDPAIPPQAKAAFNERFALWLSGQIVETFPKAASFREGSRERIIYDLVGMIEGQYARSRYPRVFESLLAIQRAQSRSVGLLHRQASPYEVDVLGISLEKGGASVLADGYLVNGALTPAQEEFLFGYGAFLQLLDDLQDVQQDQKDRLSTIFSQTAGRWPLDALTARTLQFGQRVLEGLDCFENPDGEPLKELMRQSAVLLLIDAAGRAGRFYSRPYLRELEAHSPFRFSFLAQARRKLRRQRVSLMKLVEAFAAPEDTDPDTPHP